MLGLAFPNLSQAITNTKTAFTDATTKGEKFKAVLGGIKEGISGISTVGWIGIFAVAAISAYKLIKYWAFDKPQQEVEEAKQKAEKSIAEAKQETENQTQFNSLVKQYEEIAKSGLRDAQTRTKLLDLQKQINNLVGSQAKGLDLVNGKLDTELEKLREIERKELERSIPIYEDAYRDASEATEKVSYQNTEWMGAYLEYEKEHNGAQTMNTAAKVLKDALTDLKDVDGNIVDTSIIVEKLKDFNYNNSQNVLALAKIITEEKNLHDEDKQAILDALDQIEKGAGEQNVDMHDVTSVLDGYIDMSHEERAQAIQSAIDYVEQHAKEDGVKYSELPLWNDLTNALKALDGGDGANNKATEAANNLLQRLTEYYVGSGEKVNSVDEYFEYKQKLINSVMNNELIQKAIEDGALTEEAIDKYINSYLATFDKYSNFYQQLELKTKKDKIKDTFSTDLYFDTNHDPTQNPQLTKEFNDWVNTLTPEETDIVLKLQLDTRSAKYSLADWKKVLADAKNSAEKTASKLPIIFSSKGDGEDNTFSDRIKTYRDNMMTLNEALEKLRNGELDSDSYHNLIETFPQLAGRTNDLDDAIVELMDDMDSDITTDFNTQFGKLDTQEDIEALENYEAQLLKLRESNIKFESSIDDVVSAFSTVKSVIDEYNENGYLTLDNLQSILALDDKYIAALTNEQGALDLSTESYKKLVDAELTELKAQMLQESINTVSNFKNEAEALAYLENTKTDAAEASLNLADAQWQEALTAASVRDIAEETDGVYQRAVLQARRVYDSKIALIDSYAETAFTVGELSNATDDYTESLESEKDALEESKKALEEQKQALEDSRSGYEDALGAVKDLVDWVQNYIKRIKNDELDALQKKKDAIDELIEAQKELIDAEKDEYEWNRKIADKQSAVAKDALAASIASLDDSSAGRKAQKQAMSKFEESRADLLDTLYEHEVEERKEALDELKKEQDEYYDSLISEIQDYLNDEVRIYKDACAMIDNDTGDLYGKLLWYCQNYTTTSEAEFNHMWDSAQTAMLQYNIANLSTFELLSNLQGRIYDVDNAIDTVAQSITSYESAIEGVQSKLDNLSESAQRTISDIKAATTAESEWAKPKWAYSWQGDEYTSFMNDRSAAIQDILHQIDKANGLKGVFPASAASIYGMIHKYASGTKSASGGLSLVGEEGAELLIPNKGDGILKNQIVRGLTALGSNPSQFIEEAGKKLLSGLFGTNNHYITEPIGNRVLSASPEINIVIQGDATQSTVNALKAQTEYIANLVTRNIMNKPLRNKRFI